MFSTKDIVVEHAIGKTDQPPKVQRREDGAFIFNNKFKKQHLNHVAFREEVDQIKREHEANELSKERGMM